MWLLGREMIPFGMLSGITETVPLTVLATYAFVPSGSMATPLGSVWTGTRARSRLRSRRRSKKLTLLLSGLTPAMNASSAVSASGWDDVGPGKRVIGVGCAGAGC